MNKLQISHACSIILSTLLFPMILVMIGIMLDGGISNGALLFGAVPLLMFFVVSIFLVIGPLVGIVIHFKVR